MPAIAPGVPLAPPDAVGSDIALAPGLRWVGPSVALPTIAPGTRSASAEARANAALQQPSPRASDSNLSITIVALPPDELAAATRIVEPSEAPPVRRGPTRLASLGDPTAALRPEISLSGQPAGLAPAPPTPRPLEPARPTVTEPEERETSTLRGLRRVVRDVTALEPTFATLSRAAAADPAKDPVRDAAAQQRYTVSLARYEAAASRGYANAQYSYAMRLLTGETRQADAEKAVKVLTKAAEQGFIDAQVALAFVQMQGRVVPRDLAAAAFWFSRAAERGSETAKAAREIVDPALSTADLAKERQMRADFKAIDTLASSSGLGNQGALDTQLREAATTGDENQMIDALVKGANADSRDGEGRSALINASWRGHVRIIEALLSRGADTELADREGRTAVIWGAINGHLGGVRRIIEAGADFEVADQHGITALMRAAWNGFPQTATAIIAAGAEIDRKDNAGKTALDYALQEKQTAVVNALRAARAKAQAAP